MSTSKKSDRALLNFSPAERIRHLVLVLCFRMCFPDILPPRFGAQSSTSTPRTAHTAWREYSRWRHCSARVHRCEPFNARFSRSQITRHSCARRQHLLTKNRISHDGSHSKTHIANVRDRRAEGPLCARQQFTSTRRPSMTSSRAQEARFASASRRTAGFLAVSFLSLKLTFSVELSEATTRRTVALRRITEQTLIHHRDLI